MSGSGCAVSPHNRFKAANSPGDLLLLAICHVRRNGSAALLSRTCVMDSMSPNRSHHATSHCPTAGPCKLRNGSTCYPQYSPAVAATAAAAAPAKACSCCVYLACCNAEHIQGTTATIYLLLNAASLSQPLSFPARPVPLLYESHHCQHHQYDHEENDKP